MVDVHKLQVFCSVVDTGSFSLAASKLRLSQPVVSTHVRNLESSAGLSLIDRSRRPVRATEPGKLLYDAAKRLLGGVEEVELTIAEISKAKQQEVTVSATGLIGSVILPPLVLRFRERFPHIPVHVRRGKSDEVLDHVSTGLSQLGLLLINPAKPFSVKRIGSIDLVAVRAPDKQRPPTQRSFAEVVEALGVVAPSKHNGVMSIAGRLLQRYGVARLPIRYEVGSWEAAKRTVLQGTGVTILPRQWVAQEVATQQLVELIGGRGLRTDVFIVRDRDRPSLPPESRFLEFLIAEFSRPATPAEDRLNP
jgi:DNA-binding transcriptional LysR family regulator